MNKFNLNINLMPSKVKILLSKRKKKFKKEEENYLKKDSLINKKIS